MQEIQKPSTEIQPSTSEAFWMTVLKKGPAMLSFSHVNAQRIAYIEELDQ